MAKTVPVLFCFVFLQTNVIQHFGEGQRRGHYIALAKTSKGKWCQADDAKVFEVGSFRAYIQRRYGFLLSVVVFPVSLFLSCFTLFPFFFLPFFLICCLFFIQILPFFSTVLVFFFSFLLCFPVFFSFSRFFPFSSPLFPLSLFPLPPFSFSPLFAFTLHFPSLNFVFLFHTSIYCFCVFSRSPFATAFVEGFQRKNSGVGGGVSFRLTEGSGVSSVFHVVLRGVSGPLSRLQRAQGITFFLRNGWLMYCQRKRYT